MATQTQQDEAWNAVLDEMETWERLRHQPDCPRDVQIQLDDLLSQAPLIKAAPDLLAALEALLGDVDTLLQHSTDHLDNECQGGCEYCKHRKQARAALAKAGE